jgi:hypothetical protein
MIVVLAGAVSVANDVAPSAAFGSIAAALAALARTQASLFAAIDARASAERARLAAINVRIAAARARITQMAGEEEARRVRGNGRGAAHR